MKTQIYYFHACYADFMDWASLTTCKNSIGISFSTTFSFTLPFSVPAPTFTSYTSVNGCFLMCLEF